LPEWVDVAQLAMEKYPSKEEKDRRVEGANTRYSWLVIDGKWTRNWMQRKKKILNALERVLQKRARLHAKIGNRVKLELRTMLVRAYSGGACEGEMVDRHTDNVKDQDTKEEDPRRVVSVVFVLKGGFSASGYDVRVFDRDEEEYFPHLEEGDMLALEGGSYGVAHDVGNSREPRAQGVERKTYCRRVRKKVTAHSQALRVENIVWYNGA